MCSSDLVTVSGCVAATPPVEVIRFHEAATIQIVPGTVAVTSVLEEGAGEQTGFSQSLEQRSFAAAVMRELQRVGFTEPGTGVPSEYIARLSVEQSRISAAGSRSPVSVGVGGSTGSYGSGVGLGIGINLSGPRKDRIVTDLAVRVARRSDKAVIWEGRGSMEAKDGSPASQPALAASKLAEALFRDFPGQSGETIRVP